MEEDRDADKKVKLAAASETGVTRREISLDTVKTAFIAEGLDAKAIAERYFLPFAQIATMIEEHKLVELRKAYIREGVTKIQNVQLQQAQKLMDIETDFKRLRIVQLEKMLQDFMAYFGRHGDFYKRHPVSGEILKDLDGIPMHIRIPNVAREIAQLKESVTLSEGMKKLLTDIDGILNTRKGQEPVDENDETIDMSDYDGVFKRKS